MKKKIFIVIFLILIILLVSLLYNNNISKLLNENILKYTKKVEDDFSIHTHGDEVLAVVSRINGIDTITYYDENNNEIILNCNNKTEVGIEVKPKADEKTNIYIKDSLGNMTTESFISPTANISLMTSNNKSQTDIKLDDFIDELDSKKISSCYIDLQQVGEEAVDQDTNSVNASEIFNTWTKYPNLSTVGSANYNANWSLSGNTIRTNADVSWTGYWNKNAQDFNQDIIISFDSYSGDDKWGDPIGFTFRMTEPSTNVFSFYAIELDHQYNKITLARINEWAPATQKMGLHCGPLYDATLHNCTGTILSSVSYNLPTSTWLSTKIELEGNVIRVYMGDTKVIEVTETNEDLLANGGYGPWVASNPYAYFKNVSISTTKVLGLDETMENIEWDKTKTNFLININSNSESALSKSSTSNIFNNNNVYYIGVGSEDNEEEINTFIKTIQNGLFINDSDTLDEKYNQILDFILQIVNID